MSDLIPTGVKQKVPQHIAFIMDGNGRWAKERGLARVEGHKAGVLAARRAVEACGKRGVKYVTLYAFSTENWNRAPDEVGALMELFRFYLLNEVNQLMSNNVRLKAIGDFSRLEPSLSELFKAVIKQTEANEGVTLTVALSYGGREEILSACRGVARLAADGKIDPDKIGLEDFSKLLWTAGTPDPDLLIRTSGEYRISNFLLWQLAYAEIIVTSEYWPDFDEALLDRLLDEFSRRERRFGLTSEQLAASGAKLD